MENVGEQGLALNTLLAQQTSIIEQMNRFVSNTRKTALSKRTHGYYLGRVNGWHELWNKFAANDRQISAQATPAQREHDYFSKEQYSSCEELFYDFKGELVDKLEALARSPGDSNEQSSSYSPKSLPPAAASPITLPTISLPKLHRVDSNESIASVQKSHYLKANVVGDASKVIKQFPITNENYKAAWDALIARYENKRILIAAQLRMLTSQPKSSHESANAIKAMIDTTTECLASLSNLNVSIEEWGPLLVHLLIQKLPAETHRAWEEKISDSTDYPSWTACKHYLETRFRMLETLNGTQCTDKHSKPSTKNDTPIQSFHTNQITCKLCAEKHSIRVCKAFLKCNPTERIRIAKDKGCCLNCLGSFHSIAKCRSKSRCIECKEKHHSLLHIAAPDANANSQVAVHFACEKQAVLLATAKVGIHSPTGVIIARALIDPGSQATFITSALTKQLNVATEPTSTEITGIGSNGAAVAYQSVQLLITSLKAQINVPVKALVLEKLTEFLPNIKVPHLQWSHINDLDLADPHYATPNKVDLIIGADIYPHVICDGVRKGPRGSPAGQNTIFGWILTGRINATSSRNRQVYSHVTTCPITEELKRFWEIQEINPPKQISESDAQCESFYKETYDRKGDGSFIVRLTFKKNPPNLGDSRAIAMSRYLATEKSNIRKNYLEDYNKVLAEYLALGHMTEVNSPLAVECTLGNYYMPHHAVLKPSSTTTKLRVVFDASCKTRNGLSLNDNLLTGPVLQQDITEIILRWRYHQYVFTADIEKMYRQVWIHADDAKYQRILWRPNTDCSVREYELRTVTFGVNCAPYLAIRTLLQLAEEEKNRFPKGSECLSRDFYVDDVLTGGDSIEEAWALRTELTNLLTRGQFYLRKFVTNDLRVLADVPDDQTSNEIMEMQMPGTATFKTLGIYWNPLSDEFQFKIELSKESSWTKRTVLSHIARLFDPLGWLSPIILQAKVFMQKLWVAGTNWDEVVPEYLVSEWISFINDLPNVENIRIPRRLNYHKDSEIELHGFCDSSESAYAAAIYLRITTSGRNPVVHLLSSKTRVAPLKTICIPRLELCGAVLLSRMIKTFRDMRHHEFKTILWTDSTIVLSWVLSLPHRWKSFVANRITEILENVGNTEWRHVPSEYNPADIASRGTSPSNLIENSLWWTGPDFLHKNEREWPKSTPLSSLREPVGELKPLTATN